jgi:hypothetical protein
VCGLSPATDPGEQGDDHLRDAAHGDHPLSAPIVPCVTAKVKQRTVRFTYVT